MLFDWNQFQIIFFSLHSICYTSCKKTILSLFKNLLKIKCTCIEIFYAYIKFNSHEVWCNINLRRNRNIIQNSKEISSDQKNFEKWKEKYFQILKKIWKQIFFDFLINILKTIEMPRNFWNNSEQF